MALDPKSRAFFFFFFDTHGAWAQAQNGAVFKHLLPNLKICSLSINRAHAHYCEILGKALGYQRKTCSHKDPMVSLVAECKVSTWYSVTGTEPNFGVGYLEKSVFTLVLSLESYPATVPGHQV